MSSCSRRTPVPGTSRITGSTWSPRRGGIRVSPHDLRRTYVTIAESCDVSVMALKALGYSVPITEARIDHAQLRITANAPRDEVNYRERFTMRVSSAPSGEDESQALKESPAEAGLGLPTRDAPPGGLKGRAARHYHIVSNGNSPAGTVARWTILSSRAAIASGR
jgi:hypothetical protein